MNGTIGLTSLQRKLTSVSDTQALGYQLGRLVEPNTVITLSGNLGAGKTTFTQGFANALGIRQRITSPTFTFMNQYTTAQGWRLVHVDGYRLLPTTLHLEGAKAESTHSGSLKGESIGEVSTLGIEEFLDAEDTIVVIEWPERLLHLLPKERIEIHLEYGEEERSRLFQINVFGTQYQALIKALV